MSHRDHSRFADLLMNSEDNLLSLLSLFRETLIFIFDSDGKFSFGHTESHSRLHSDPDHFLGKTVGEIMPEHVVEPFRKAFEKNRRGEVAEFEYWMDLITHIGWFRATCTPVMRDGTFDGSIAIVSDITKEKNARDALESSEKNYRTLVEMAAMGIVIISGGLVVYSNPVTSEISGFTNEEIVGQSFLDFIAPSERERVSRIHEDRLKGQSAPDVYELRMLKKNGRLIDIEVSVKLVDYQGKPSVQVLIQDITTRKSAERELLSIQDTLQKKVSERTGELEQYRHHLEEIVEERTGRLRDTISLLRTEIEERILAEERIEHLNLILRAIREINQLITNETDVQKLIDGACKRLVETRGYKDAWIFLLNSDGSFSTASEDKYGEDLTPLMDHIREGNYTPCLQKSLEEDGTWISDEDRRICEHCCLRPDDDTARRIMACRLESHERIYGVLTVTSMGENPPDSEETALFREVCNDIAFALDSIEQEKARKMATKALKESQNRYETLFENAAAAILFLEGDTILECNTKCAELYGGTREEVTGMTPYQLSPDKQPDGRDSREAALEKIDAALRQGPQYFRWLHKRINGEEFPAEVGLSTVSVDDKVYVQAIVKDITSREKAETALRESERNYRTLYTNVPVGLFRSNTEGNGRFLEVNPAMASMFGYKSPDKLLQKEPASLFLKASDRQKMLGKLGNRSILKDFSSKMKRADGSEFWASVSARRFELPGEEGLVIDGIIQDISESREFEASLRKSLENLKSAIEGTVSAMSILVEMKDPYTSGHQKGVAHLACAIAKEMGLPDQSVDCVRIAATLHDLGKLSIPTEILSKPGTLTEYEVKYLKTHPQAGYDILENIEFPWPIARVILQHHERMDGSGYPNGLKDGEIMMEARIIAVSDVVEATASRRPYRASRGIDVALEAIEAGSGTLYDPDVVKACTMLFREKGFSLIDHESLFIGADFAI